MTLPNLDAEIDRANTQSVKWGLRVEHGFPPRFELTERFFGPNRDLPLWVADMDFQCPPAILTALRQRVDHGIFGYTIRDDAFHDAVIHWMRTRQSWQVRREWIVGTPGVVPALHMLVRTFVQPGQKVLVQTPVYHPFFSAIAKNGAVQVNSPLREINGGYEMDFDDLAAKLADPDLTLAILCHPHNPVGRVWTRTELTRFAELCRNHNVLVVADEIHGDLIMPGVEFTPYGALPEEFVQRAIICTAPSKTFNLAGLHTSNIIIPDAELRGRFMQTLDSLGLFGANTFGVVATTAGYTGGADWLDAVIAYIAENYATLTRRLAAELPGVRVFPLQGTYLAWLDFRAFGQPSSELEARLLDHGGVYLEDGSIFGPEGDGFLRMNLACPRGLLNEAITRIVQEFSGR
mgnify:CR=1 FL=1